MMFLSRMNDGPIRHYRRSIRLQGYDYSQPGAYFVTVCVQEKECLFGKILGEEIQLNDAGQMVERWWSELANKFAGVETDESIVMPNHFHGILGIVGAALCGRPSGDEDSFAAGGHPHRGAPTEGIEHLRKEAPTLGDIVDWFKTMVTNGYIRGVKGNGWTPFPRRLWQRGYYEHIVRSEDELNKIREYIALNPARWAWDAQNPLAKRHSAPDAPWQI